MSRRVALALTAALVTLGALPGHAAPKPQVVDPKGDSVGAQPGTDIVSVLYATTGTGKGRSYKPTRFVVTMTLAGAVITTPGLAYETTATTAACGDVILTAQQGSPYSTALGVNGWANWGDCTTGTAPDGVELIRVKVAGNKLIWDFGLKSIPKPLKIGSVFSSFEARVDPSNPVIPFPSYLTFTDLGLIDKATGTTPWKLG